MGQEILKMCGLDVKSCVHEADFIKGADIGSTVQNHRNSSFTKMYATE